MVNSYLNMHVNNIDEHSKNFNRQKTTINPFHIEWTDKMTHPSQKTFCIFMLERFKIDLLGLK